jgi:hypothetical protein
MSETGSVDDLRETVARMESRLSELRDADVERLLRAYRELVPRFERDLPDERDVLLSRGATLMFIQQVAGA